MMRNVVLMGFLAGTLLVASPAGAMVVLHEQIYRVQAEAIAGDQQSEDVDELTYGSELPPYSIMAGWTDASEQVGSGTTLQAGDGSAAQTFELDLDTTSLLFRSTSNISDGPSGVRSQASVGPDSPQDAHSEGLGEAGGSLRFSVDQDTVLRLDARFTSELNAGYRVRLRHEASETFLFHHQQADGEPFDVTLTESVALAAGQEYVFDYSMVSWSVAKQDADASLGSAWGRGDYELAMHVPEPATLMLLAMGAGLSLWRRPSLN